MSDSLIVQRHEVELEKYVTFIHSVSLCVWGLFFKADWSKKADPFSFQSCSVVIVADGAVKHESHMSGGFWVGTLSEIELKRKKDLPSSYEVSVLLHHISPNPPVPLLPLSKGPDLPSLLFHTACKPQEHLATISAHNQHYYVSSTLLMR